MLMGRSMHGIIGRWLCLPKIFLQMILYRCWLSPEDEACRFWQCSGVASGAAIYNLSECLNYNNGMALAFKNQHCRKDSFLKSDFYSVKNAGKAVIMGQVQVNLSPLLAAYTTPDRENCKSPQSHKLCRCWQTMMEATMKKGKILPLYRLENGNELCNTGVVKGNCQTTKQLLL